MPEPATLESAVRRTGAPLCVGIDPVRDRLPAGDDLQVIQDFGLRIVDQLADLVPAVKIQSACLALPTGARNWRSINRRGRQKKILHLFRSFCTFFSTF